MTHYSLENTHMLKEDNLYTTELARGKLIIGIKKIARAVGSTMGTAGSNAIIEAIESPGHLMTNDGYSIANCIQLSDPIEEMGRKILVESINRANKASGDGSSTTCVLTAAIIEQGMKYIEKEHPMTIKRELEACIPVIEKSIAEQTRLITEPAQVKQVASISSEDEGIGQTISDIYAQIGPKGIIHWDVSKTAVDSYTIGKGITVEGATYYSPYMCDVAENGQSTNQIRIAHPYIMLTKQKVATSADLNAIAALLNAKDVKDLVIFADEVDPLVVPDLLKTRLMRGFRIAVIKMPVLWKDQWYEDLSKATGAKVIDPAAGFSLKDAGLEALGRAGNVVVTRNDTYLDGIADVTEHTKALEEEGSDDSKLRASRLNTKTARYFVGAQSDSALSYRRLKVEDAISAAWQALNGGVVAGGGITLFKAALRMDDVTIGGRILRDALEAPALQIMLNTGIEEHEAKNNLATSSFSSASSDLGFDTRTGKMVDMFEAGIIDPANVVLNAARNAISVAAAILTAKTVVTLPREEQPQIISPNVVQR